MLAFRWSFHRAPPRFPLGSHRQCVATDFTLVELLVVIGIISVLTSLLMPALARATSTSRSVACQSNQRQIFITLEQYRGDYTGWLPAGTANSTWDFAANLPMPNGNATRFGCTVQLQAYTYGLPNPTATVPNFQDPIFLCPEERSASMRPQPASAPVDERKASYDINFQLWKAVNGRSDKPMMLTQLRAKQGGISKAILFVEKGDSSATDGGTASTPSTYFENTAGPSKFGTYVSFYYMFRHMQDVQMALLFADGHVWLASSPFDRDSLASLQSSFY